MRVLQIGKFYPISGGVEKVMYDITMGLSQKHVDRAWLEHQVSEVRLAT